MPVLAIVLVIAVLVIALAIAFATFAGVRRLSRRKAAIGVAVYRESVMKRLHVHLSVTDLSQSQAFYTALFGRQADEQRSDYAKWMLDDPRVNFAISQLGHAPGLDHLGFQVETRQDLEAMTSALKAANLAVIEEGASVCCYARSDKGWVHDPQGIAWETFVTHGQSTVYGVDRAARDNAAGACCAPNATATQAKP